MRNCFIKESGVIVNGNVNFTAAEGLFYECSESDEIPLKSEWKNIVQDSIAGCESSFPIKKGIRDEDYTYFYNKFIDCVRMLNFVNCTDFSNEGNCTLIKDTMKKCNSSDYEFLHELFFEGTFYRENNSKN